MFILDLKSVGQVVEIIRIVRSGQGRSRVASNLVTVQDKVGLIEVEAERVFDSTARTIASLVSASNHDNISIVAKDEGSWSRKGMRPGRCRDGAVIVDDMGGDEDFTIGEALESEGAVSDSVRSVGEALKTEVLGIGAVRHIGSGG